MNKIALHYPEVYEVARFGSKRKEFPPFGILYLASFAENLGFNVKIIKITNNKYIHNLTDYNIIGFSIPSSITYNIVKKSILSSKYNTRSLIILGGLHPTLYPEDTL